MSGGATGLTAEEQALFDELEAEHKQEKGEAEAAEPAAGRKRAGRPEARRAGDSGSRPGVRPAADPAAAQRAGGGVIRWFRMDRIAEVGQCCGVEPTALQPKSNPRSIAMALIDKIFGHKKTLSELDRQELRKEEILLTKQRDRLFKRIEQISIDKKKIFEQGATQKSPELRKALAQDFELKTQEQLMAPAS